MELVDLVRMNAFDLGDHAVSVEFGILAFAGALVLALLVAKARRAYLQKMRRASSAGYYDYDVARYGGAAPGRSLIEATETSGPQSLASTFSAPTRGSRQEGPILRNGSLRPRSARATLAEHRVHLRVGSPTARIGTTTAATRLRVRATPTSAPRSGFGEHRGRRERRVRTPAPRPAPTSSIVDPTSSERLRREARPGRRLERQRRSPVDHQRGPVDETRLTGAEEGDDPSEVGRVAHDASPPPSSRIRSVACGPGQIRFKVMPLPSAARSWAAVLAHAHSPARAVLDEGEDGDRLHHRVGGDAADPSPPVLAHGGDRLAGQSDDDSRLALRAASMAASSTSSARPAVGHRRWRSRCRRSRRPHAWPPRAGPAPPDR